MDFAAAAGENGADAPRSRAMPERKTLLLTGASRGIGHATVKRFSREGWRVITCSRQASAENCPGPAGPEDHIPADLSDPEDVGGACGFMDFLEAVLDPAHEEHQRMLTWYGGPFNPDDIDERHIRIVLSMLADRRKGPLASHRSGRRGRKA